MKIWHIFIVVLAFSACSSTISSLDGYDESLPVVKNIKAIADVGSVGFEWEVIHSSKVRGFVLYRDSGAGFEEVAYIKNPLTSHFVDSGLIPETEYSYYFYTLSNNAHSKRSETIKVKTSFIDPVTNLYASNNYPKKVKLLWNPHANPSVSHYLIQRQEANSEFKTIANVNDRLLVEYFDEDLADESNYKYRVIAMDYMGNPARPSKVVTARTREKPKNALKITASTNLANTIALVWDTAASAAEYKLYRSKTLDGAYSHIATTSNTRFSDNINAPSQRFYYKVSIVDALNVESNPSAAVLGSTRGLPSAPKITKGYVDKREARIEWEANVEAKYYFVYRKSGIFESERFRVNGTSFSDRDMNVGKEYTYSVVAVDKDGLESAHSEEVVLSIK